VALVVDIFVSSVSVLFPLWQGNGWSSRAERPGRVAQIQSDAALRRWCPAVIVPGHRTSRRAAMPGTNTRRGSCNDIALGGARWLPPR